LSSPIIVHTGPADRASRWTAALTRGGFVVRCLPAVASEAVVPSPEALAEVAAAAPYAIVVVTSPRAPAAFAGMRRWIADADIATVGEATAEACREAGFEPKWIGAGGSRPFLEALAGKVDVRGRSVLFPRGDLVTSPALPELAGRGARIVAPVVYRTVAVAQPAAEVRAALAGAAGVTLTSPSGVRSFVTSADAAGCGAEARGLFAAALGPSTEAAARKAGFRWRGVCRRPGPSSLAALLARALDLKDRPG
jgi:uroporphyrinogen III methyltransferase / synthase